MNRALTKPQEMGAGCRLLGAVSETIFKNDNFAIEYVGNDIPPELRIVRNETTSV